MALTFGAATIFLGKATALSTAYPFSVAGWVNSNSLATSNALWSEDDGTTSNGWELFVTTTGKIEIRVDVAAASSNAQTSTALSTGTWNHFAGVFTSATSRTAYLNAGGSATDVTSKSPTGLTRTSIGNNLGRTVGCTATLAFLGQYKIALSVTDVTTLSSGVHPIKVHPEALIACVDFIGSSPEMDRVSATGWTVNGSPTLAANPPMHMPRGPIMLSPAQTIAMGSVTMQALMGIASSPNLTGVSGTPYTMWGGGHT